MCGSMELSVVSSLYRNPIAVSGLISVRILPRSVMIALQLECTQAQTAIANIRDTHALLPQTHWSFGVIPSAKVEQLGTEGQARVEGSKMLVQQRFQKKRAAQDTFIIRSEYAISPIRWRTGPSGDTCPR